MAWIKLGGVFRPSPWGRTYGIVTSTTVSCICLEVFADSTTTQGLARRTSYKKINEGNKESERSNLQNGTLVVMTAVGVAAVVVIPVIPAHEQALLYLDGEPPQALLA